MHRDPRDALRAAACPNPSLHTVEGAPIQALADLLRTATEFDEIADLVRELMVNSAAYTEDDVTRLDALRAAVRALNEPLPSRFADAHSVATTVKLPPATQVATACECVFSCADDPRTACSLSGRWHVHAEWPCPVHPHAPGDRPMATGGAS